MLTGMTQPMALVFYEKLLPGTQLVNRLQDLNYRVRAVNDAAALVSCAEQEKPMLVVADLQSERYNLCEIIGRLKQSSATGHIPVLAFAPDDAEGLQEAARTAGAALVASESAVVAHLPQFLDRVLEIQ